MTRDSRTKKRILVVDDDPACLKLLSHRLRAAGYCVSEARHAYAAIHSVVHAPPDLILTDVVMPEMDGLDLAAELRADEFAHHIPIIAITATAGRFDRLSALAAGCNDFVTKPVSSRALLQCVATHLRAQRSCARSGKSADRHTHID